MALNLDQFIEDFNINMSAVNRIKKRVFLVGRFNQKELGHEPDTFLFTNREISDDYRKNFTSVSDLRSGYRRFVEVLAPAIAERLSDPDAVNPFRQVEQVVPTGDEKSFEVTSKIDEYDWYFQRAVKHSDQPEYKDVADSKENSLLGRQGDKERGKSIFKDIRESLGVYCEFQPEAHHLVECVSYLLGKCGAERGKMPPYAQGGALPDGFPERLISFLFSEKPDAQFDVRGLNFTGIWKQLDEEGPFRNNFCQIVQAFRDEILEQDSQYNMVSYRNVPLPELAKEAIDYVRHRKKTDGEYWELDEFRKKFQRARFAFNKLRQLLRSKVLLSMVVEWVFLSFYDLDEVRDLAGPDAARDQAVRDVIFDRYEENNIAKPVVRPSEMERHAFSKLLGSRFELVMKAIVADEDTYDERLAALTDGLDMSEAETDKMSETLKGIVESARDSEQRAIFASILGPKAEVLESVQQGFLEAAKVVLTDVLCPRLYQKPITSIQDLRDWFKKEIISVYLTAIFLSDSNQDAVKKIADDHLAQFEAKIDKTHKTIKEKNEVLQWLLDDFLSVLSSKEVRRQLQEGIQDLQDILGFLEEGGQSTTGAGAGAITPKIGKDSSSHDSVVKTRPDAEEKIREVVDVRIGKEIERRLEHAIERHRLENGVIDRGESDVSAASQSVSLASESGEKSDETIFESDDEGNLPVSGYVLPIDEKVSKVLDQDTKIAAILDRIAQTSSVTKDSASIDVDEKTEGKIEEEKRSQKRRLEKELLERKDEISVEAGKDVSRDPKIVGDLAEGFKAFDRTLSVIYSRYLENPDKLTFRNKVERMTLINMMMLFQKDLGLGRVNSNLYHMLLDMVLHINPETLDPRDFMREQSLTRYFDDADLDSGKSVGEEGHGITSLRQTLEVQATDSLANIESFVSELHGVKYLLDRLRHDPQAEVIIVNATAGEFLTWFNDDNLKEGERYRGRLHSSNLASDNPDKAVIPGLVYMTDIAFGADPDRNKVWFLQELKNIALSDGAFGFVVSPICFSTEAQGGPMDQATDQWKVKGKQYANDASQLPVSVTILGPSPRLNRSDDGFRTILPAGYVFALHFLTGASQDLTFGHVGTSSEGRFRVLGFGAVPVNKNLDRVLWGEGHEGETYAFAADFYLFILLTILNAANTQGARLGPKPKEFFNAFTMFRAADRKPFKSTKVLNEALLGAAPNAYLFGLDLAGDGTLHAVKYDATNSVNGVLDGGASLSNITDIAWFDAARHKLQLMPGKDEKDEQS